MSGRDDATEYQAFVADLVNFMDYMAEPYKNKRISLGIVVLLYLDVLFVPCSGDVLEADVHFTHRYRRERTGCPAPLHGGVDASSRGGPPKIREARVAPTRCEIPP